MLYDDNSEVCGKRSDALGIHKKLMAEESCLKSMLA